jgi:hypothetical protein
MQKKSGLGAVGCGLLLALLISGANDAHAQGTQQQTSSNSYTDVSGFVWSGNQGVPQQAVNTSPNLSSTVVQSGQMNNATATLAGSGNVTTQYQLGSQNTSTLLADGKQNTLTTTQIGNSNTSSISVVGSNNNISNLQVGSGLTYQLSVIGTSAPVSVQQFGRR